MVDVDRQKKKMKPQVVINYNDTMGAVELVDQHVKLPCAQKMRKVLQNDILSTFRASSLQFLCNLLQNKRGKTPLQYRLCVRQNIIEKHRTQITTPKGGCPGKSASLLQLSGRHFPEQIQPTQKKANPTRKCAMCTQVQDASGEQIHRDRVGTTVLTALCNSVLPCVPCHPQHLNQDSLSCNVKYSHIYGM
jgi:hypothetical protein